MLVIVLLLNVILCNNPVNGKSMDDVTFGIKVQNASISLVKQNASIKELLSAIQKQSGVSILYNDALIKGQATKSVNLNGATIEHALQEVLKGTNLSYKIEENSVSIFSKPQQQQQSQVKKIYPIEGKIFDEKGKPLVGATVIIDGTTMGAITDQNGSFIIKSSSKEVTLAISFSGFEGQKVKAISGTMLTVKMKITAVSIDDVQIIGYGTQKKRTLISSVSSVKSTDIKEIPTSSLESLLQGRMAGVEITNISGAPGGGGAIVAVRGYNSMVDVNTTGLNNYGEPLYVIDGIPVQGFSSPITGSNALSSIDPNTIESIEVLKDAASAAIYGSRAGNGVILITTKKGKEGKATFSVNGSYSLAILPSTLVQTGGRAAREYALNLFRNEKLAYRDPLTGVYKFPTSIQEVYGIQGAGSFDNFWRKAVTGYSGNETPVMAIVQDSLNRFYNNSTDWFKYAFQTGQIINANVQASGGTEKTQYLVGAGYYNEKGIQKGSDFSRINMIANLNVQPVKNFSIDTRLNLSYRGRNRGTLGAAKKFETMPIDPKKSSSFMLGGGEVEREMLKVINSQIEKNQSYSLMGSMSLKYQFMKGLVLSINGSANFALGTVDGFRPTILETDNLNLATFDIEKNLNVMNENLLNFDRKINEDHNIGALLGLSFEKNSATAYSGKGKGGASDYIHYIYDGFPEIPSTSTPTKWNILQKAFSNLQQTALLSMFFRGTYNYKERYMAEFTFRRDGSSVFGDNNKYANFPAAAVGWAFSEEPFMKRLWWLNHSKIRFSYGKSGEVFQDPYRAHGLLIPGGSFLGRPILNVDNTNNGGMINRDLGWVQHDQYDIGLDFNFLDYKLELKVDYYYRWSSGALASTKLPATIYPYESQWINANGASNEGLEFEFVGNIITKGDWYWKTRFNLTRNWNRLKSTYNNKDVGVSNDIAYHTLGQPLYQMYTFQEGPVYDNISQIPYIYHSDGAKHTQYLSQPEYPFNAGMRQIIDSNGDLKVDRLDMLSQGSTLAVFYGGWGNDLRWKNLDLSFLFSYSFGRRIVNMFSIQSLEPKDAAGGANIYYDLSKITWWEKDGDSSIPNVFPELAAHDKTMLQFYPKTSKNVERVNYVKLKNITLGYNMPTSLCKSLRLTGLRVFVTAENLFTITNYSGPDPEMVSLYDGEDSYKNYPLARKLSVGLTVNF